ncbi:MAG: DUF4124 domain-containing protein, partial [Acetobacteraceae bacterium]
MCLCLCLTLVPRRLPAEVYRRVDGAGVTHFSNRPPRRSPRDWAPAQAFPVRAYDAIILAAARYYALPPALLGAVIAAESNFNPTAVSPRGAQGLMQLMPLTAELMGVADSLAPLDNIFGGARYLR